MGLEIKPFDPALFITIPYCSAPPMILPITSLLWAPWGCWRWPVSGFKVWPLGCRCLPHCEAPRPPTVKPAFWAWEPSSKTPEEANKNRSGGQESESCTLQFSCIPKTRGGSIHPDATAAADGVFFLFLFFFPASRCP